MNADDLSKENEALRERLYRLGEASLRITEDLDLDTVLQGGVDGARSLTGASRGCLTIVDESGELEAFLTSGVTEEEYRTFAGLTGAIELLHYLSGMAEPLRVADFSSHTASVGLAEVGPPLGPVRSFLGVPIRHRGTHVGTVSVAHKEGGLEFTQEDEDTLRMFASQAAMAISNARRHQDEQRARADLETLINTSPVGVIVFDAAKGVPLSSNREATRLVDDLRNPGQSPEEMLETITYRRGDGREISLQEFALAQALSVAETVRAEEIAVRVPDGRSVTVLVNATPIRSERGEVESVVVTMQDMSAMEETERLRAEFLAMVSHELRAPLTSIKGSAAAVLGTSSVLDTAEMQQFFRIVDDQANHMLELISNLLYVARIETGRLSVTPETTDPATLVDRARNTFLSGGGRDSIHIDLPPDLPRVMADRRRIVQVLGNLLSNAERQSPATTSIRLSAGLEGVHVWFSLSDDGVGVSADRLPLMFRKFSRLDSVEGGGDGTIGSGLGLSICKGIVEAHGGRIWAESDGPGLGAKFTFTLPIVEDHATVPTSLPTPFGRVEGQQALVLAVDDDPLTLRYVRHALSDAGYSVIVTADPEEALDLMEQERPDLALVDLLLPGSDGIDLMQDILDIADIPVILLSAYGRDQVIARAFEMGADDYIGKPFSPTELVARIRAALRKQEGPPRDEPAEPYVLGDLTIDYAERRVTVAGFPVQLTTTEYRLISELATSAGRVLTHDQILRRVWGRTRTRDARVIRTHLMRLRRKLGEDAASPKYIFAEPRVGYRMPEGEVPDLT